MVMSKLQFDADYEGGCLDRVVCCGADFYHIILRPDTWYYFNFRVRGCAGRDVIFQFSCRDILAPGYADGRGRWIYDDGSIVHPVISYDGRNWEPIEYIEKCKTLVGTFRFRHKFTSDEAFIAFGHPYTYTDLQNYLAALPKVPELRISTIGNSRGGVPQPLLTLTANPEAKETVAIVSREDADEITGSFAAEGMINYLLSGAPECKRFLSRYILEFVPMVCVDGVIAGSSHSCGYGYGGYHWHEESVTPEQQNVKDYLRRLAADGRRFVLAGMVHGGMTMQPVHPVDFSYSDLEFGRILVENRTKFWDPLEITTYATIKAKGFFARFMMDEFGVRSTFSCHMQGTSADNLRNCGRDMFRGILHYLPGIF